MFVFDLYSNKNYKNNFNIPSNPIEKIDPRQRQLIKNTNLFGKKRIIIPNMID